MPRPWHMPSDPVRLGGVDRAMRSPDVIDLVDEIVDGPMPVAPRDAPEWKSHRRPSLSITVTAAVAIVIAAAVAVPLALIGRGGPSDVVTTAYQPGKPFFFSANAESPDSTSGRWQLLSAVLPMSGTWRQNRMGPPP